MIRSMTGYGVADFSIGEGRFSIEIKGVNHRFLEINIKASERFSPLETRIREVVKQSCSRGSMFISIISAGEGGGALKANIPLAKQYLGILQELKSGLGLKGEIDISLLLKFRDIFSSAQRTEDAEMDWVGLKAGLGIALNALVRMRVEEGAVLAKDIALRLDCMEAIISKMDNRAPLVAESYREKLRQRMVGVLSGVNIDEVRLLTEVALFAERSNITEELVRLGSHIRQFRDMMQMEEPGVHPNDASGRKMDFLCQEILREINTIGSKANDFELSNLVVSAKAELEKIREQVQNIE